MAEPESSLSIDTARGAVSARFSAPPDPFATIAVAHGAGAGMEHPFIVGFARASVGEGLATLRFNFPYLEAGRRSPDPERALRDAWRAAFAAAAARSAGRPVWAGGKSLGGRIASMAVADAEIPAAGLVFLGYPLHPPGKHDRVRDEHLYRIEVPMLFLQGTEDPFANAELLAGVVDRLGDRAEIVWFEGGGHSFEVRGRKRDPREVGASLASHAAAFIRKHA
jgi:uncharacterized protein